MFRKVVSFAFITIICVSMVCSGQAAVIQRGLSDGLIRLHVVGNSNGVEDQQVKLKVRDAVLECVKECADRCGDRAMAGMYISGKLDQIAGRANEKLAEQGFDSRVRVTLCREQFPVRYYDTFALPSGEYQSLRVTIGEGKGKNWWCVVFPSLCFAATGEEWAEATAAFSEEEAAYVEQAGETEIRLLSFDMLERFWDWLTK